MHTSSKLSTVLPGICQLSKIADSKVKIRPAVAAPISSQRLLLLQSGIHCSSQPSATCQILRFSQHSSKFLCRRGPSKVLPWHATAFPGKSIQLRTANSCTRVLTFFLLCQGECGHELEGHVVRRQPRVSWKRALAPAATRLRQRRPVHPARARARGIGSFLLGRRDSTCSLLQVRHSVARPPEGPDSAESLQTKTKLLPPAPSLPIRWRNAGQDWNTAPRIGRE